MRQKFIGLIFGAAIASFAFPAVAGTLDDVKARGHLQCGVSQGIGGFSMPDSQNNWTGLDLDDARICTAIAESPGGPAHDAMQIVRPVRSSDRCSWS
ncbi:hypothetical protein ACFSQT_23000 [Mesorhizobium calcicola]|uniref:Uncharacterized protein n=1 Tax=Mesorhizobium calcicola TaxID=1300310 RepID=A0ABW4WH10_9HYPH